MHVCCLVAEQPGSTQSVASHWASRVQPAASFTILSRLLLTQNRRRGSTLGDAAIAALQVLQAAAAGGGSAAGGGLWRVCEHTEGKTAPPHSSSLSGPDKVSRWKVCNCFLKIRLQLQCYFLSCPCARTQQPTKASPVMSFSGLSALQSGSQEIIDWILHHKYSHELIFSAEHPVNTFIVKKLIGQICNWTGCSTRSGHWKSWRTTLLLVKKCNFFCNYVCYFATTVSIRQTPLLWPFFHPITHQWVAAAMEGITNGGWAGRIFFFPYKILFSVALSLRCSCTLTAC